MGPWRSRPGLGLCPPLVPATHWICTARASSRGWQRGSDCHSGSRGARGARGSRQRTAPVAHTCARRPTLPPAACGGDPQGRRPRRTLGTRRRRCAGPRASPAGQLPLPFPSSGRPRDLTRRRAGGDAPLPSCSQTCRLPGPAKAQALGRLTLTGTVRLGDPVRLPQSQAHLATRRTGRTPPVCLPCKLPSGSEEQLLGGRGGRGGRGRADTQTARATDSPAVWASTSHPGRPFLPPQLWPRKPQPCPHPSSSKWQPRPVAARGPVFASAFAGPPPGAAASRPVALDLEMPHSLPEAPSVLRPLPPVPGQLFASF